MSPVTNGELNQNGVPPTPPLPSWLKAEFFADVVKKRFGKCEITNVSAKPALQKGENYTSNMHRIVIDVKLPDGQIEKAHYISKSMIESAMALEMIGNLSLFPKEIEIYEKIIPQMEDLYKRAGIEISLGPKCVKTQLKPTPIIVLEDLTATDYENIKRQEGMNLIHMEATLEKVAMWHAATARIQQLRGHYSDHYRANRFPPGLEKMFKPIMKALWPIIKQAMLGWGDCEKYIDKIDRLQYRVLDMVREADKINPLEFNVLNHGDLWSNNIMFRHNEDGSVADVKFVDLQICQWGSPTQDLSYFIMTSCSNDIRVEKFEYFIKYYHDHLVQNLKLLKYSTDIPSLVDMQIMMLKKGCYAYNAATGILPIVLMEPNDNAEMETMFSAGAAGMEFKRQMYENPRLGAAMKKILPFLDNRGILDL